MKKDSSFFANLVLYFGSGFLIFLVIFNIIVPLENRHIIINYLPIVAALSGIAVLVLSIRYTKRLHQIFIGFELLFWGIFVVLHELRILPYTFMQWWPMIGVTAGIFLCIAGKVKYQKVLTGYFIPSLTLFLLGIWFMLFSFNIVKVPFQTVAIVGGPLFLMMSGVFIIALFLLQKNHSNLVAKDDENIDLETDEMSSIAPLEETLE
ncbi:MAG: hypothetical protein J5710_09870 [Treponema sp.]|nr:hypothetical protein [Treponema sp.]